MADDSALTDSRIDELPSNPILQVASEKSGKESSSDEDWEKIPEHEGENVKTEITLHIQDSDSKPKSTDLGKIDVVKEKTDGENVKESDEDQDPEWLDVLGNGQLKKKILKKGQEGLRPQVGQDVRIRVKGKLTDGTEVDCYDGVQMTLGDGDFIQGWDLCITLMEIGEVALLITDSRFAYGDVGRFPDIPPNAEITYEIEVLDVIEPPELSEISVEERLEMADKKRERGNQNFVRKDYPNAISSYNRAISIVEDLKASSEDENSERVKDLKLKCYNNLAATQLKIDALDAAIKSCNSALKLDPNSVKALFRKGKVLASQGEYEEATSEMKKALLLEPSNKTIYHELSKVVASKNKEKESEKQLYQRMVGDMANITDIPKKNTASATKWIILSAILVAVIGVAVTFLIFD